MGTFFIILFAGALMMTMLTIILGALLLWGGWRWQHNARVASHRASDVRGQADIREPEEAYGDGYRSLGLEIEEDYWHGTGRYTD